MKKITKRVKASSRPKTGGRALMYNTQLDKNGLLPLQNKRLAELAGRDRASTAVLRDGVDMAAALLYSGGQAVDLLFAGMPVATARLVAPAPSIIDRPARPEFNTGEPQGKGRPQTFAEPLVKNGLRRDQWAIVRAVARVQGRNFRAVLRDCAEMLFAVIDCKDEQPVTLYLSGMAFAEARSLRAQEKQD